MLSLAPDLAGKARLEEIDTYYLDLERALRGFYNPTIAATQPQFVGYTPTALQQELNERLAELELTCVSSMLFALEATFRTDYEKRRRAPKRAPLVREFRALYRANGKKVSFEYDLLEHWKKSKTLSATLILDLGDAIKLRHWIAHGRYWRPQLGRHQYDFVMISLLAKRVMSEVPLID